VVEELDFPIKASPLQIKREGDNVNIIFSKTRLGVFMSSYRI
jgi:hypothetical protein